MTKNEIDNTVVIDLDGTLIDIFNCKNHCDYSQYPKNTKQLKRLECPLARNAIEVLDYLKSKNLKIIIYTGRTEKERKVTEQWLKQNTISYDELIMNKPRGFIYIDDLGYQYSNWLNAQNEILRRFNKRVVSRKFMEHK